MLINILQFVATFILEHTLTFVFLLIIRPLLSFSTFQFSSMFCRGLFHCDLLIRRHHTFYSKCYNHLSWICPWELSPFLHHIGREKRCGDSTHPCPTPCLILVHFTLDIEPFIFLGILSSTIPLFGYILDSFYSKIFVWFNHSFADAVIFSWSSELW